MSPKTHFNFKPPLGYCGDCIWLTDAGYCHRMPPTAQSASTPCWPIVGTLDWCGEFTPTIRETYSCGLKKCVRDICDRCPDPPPSVRPAEEDPPSPTLGDCPAPAVRRIPAGKEGNRG